MSRLREATTRVVVSPRISPVLQAIRPIPGDSAISAEMYVLVIVDPAEFRTVVGKLGKDCGILALDHEHRLRDVERDHRPVDFQFLCRGPADLRLRIGFMLPPKRLPEGCNFVFALKEFPFQDLDAVVGRHVHLGDAQLVDLGVAGSSPVTHLTQALVR